MKKSDSCVSPYLIEVLEKIMGEPLFSPFRLVGGTNLAIRFNHRISTDIDLFTDAEYGSLKFKNYYRWFCENFPYCEPTDSSSVIGMGRTYYVGEDANDAIKVDLMYEGDKFLYPTQCVNNIRMADTFEIAVMKLDAIFHGGRKKDYWDLHYLLIDEGMALSELIDRHAERFPYQHDRKLMIEKLTDFRDVEDEPDPICRLGKFWDVIKLDILDSVESLDR